MKLKIALLLCLMGAALFSGAEALRSLKSGAGEAFPEELYAPFARNADCAAYVLGRAGDYLAVFPAGRREPLRVTQIELQTLRRVDRAMVEAGLPVRSLQELLQLLEDLGS
ncbi:MAG: hypothetical protein K6E35_01175 [Bacteroidales bacterium]|jgi:hypothetical protein|nr:hypothetical protein [Bacteroidales bacterium]